jgi:hypothetical protein
MCYTHYGIGHPAALRKMTKDCADADLLGHPETDENSNNMDWESDVQPCEGDRERGEADDDHSDGGGGEDNEDEDEQEYELEDGEMVNNLDDLETELHGEDEGWDQPEDKEYDYQVSF